MNRVEGIGRNSRLKLSKVISISKGGITPSTVSKALNVSSQEAGRLLSRWENAGWLQRVKRGFYISIPVESFPGQLAIENPWAIVSKIYSPGYIGGFSAIKYWDLSEQIFETIIFFTTKKVKARNPEHIGIKLQLKTIKPSKLFGTKTVWVDSVKIQVSDPSRTMIDFLDDPPIGGGMTVIRDFFNSYLESKHKNISRLIEYADLLGNKTVFKRLGFLCETLNTVDEKTLADIKFKISKGYSKFDPSISNTKIIRRWNLQIPVSWAKVYDRKK